MEQLRLTVEAGIDTAITQEMEFARGVSGCLHQSTSARGIENNELRLIAGTAYNF